MPSVQNNTAHPATTARRSLTYVFTPKHHGGSPTASCWLTGISFAQEFSIFDRTDGIVVPAGIDNRQVSDLLGNLYGYEVLETATQHLRELGTWDQQMAEYPAPHEGSPWHGYPIWPINPVVTPPQYNGQRCRPDHSVFDRMVQLGDITDSHRKRLKTGHFI